MSFEASFTATSAQYLRDTYMQRIAGAIEVMTPQDLWRRSHDGTNSVANLLLHLEGNVRQWILVGVGGAEDRRDRGAEFAARGGLDAPELLAPLRETVAAAAARIEDLDSAALARRFTVQGIETTGLEAVYHVVEHFSWHTGQIVAFAKERAGPDHGLAFYDDGKLNAPHGE